MNNTASTCPLANAQSNNIRVVMDAEGNLVGDLPEPDLCADQLIDLYEMLALIRSIYGQDWTLQRSGRVEFRIPCRGLIAPVLRQINDLMIPDLAH